MAEHELRSADRRLSVEKDEEQHVECKDQINGAVRATEGEHAMTFREAARKYPQAIFWSCCFSMALVMQGFDHAFIYGFIGFPPFEQKYGTPNENGVYEIPANDQAAITNCVAAGEIVGLIINGYLADWLGYRKVMAGSLLLFMGFVFLQFFAVDIGMYIGAEFALGVPWGVFQTITTTYAAEISPNALRPCTKSPIPPLMTVTRANIVCRPHHVRTRMLVCRVSHRHRHHSRFSPNGRPMGVSYSVCSPVDPSHPDTTRSVLRARITMVADQ